jgi:signal transduction histidine kinase
LYPNIHGLARAATSRQASPAQPRRSIAVHDSGYINPAAGMMGLDTKNLLGLEFWEACAEAKGTGLESALRRALETGESIELDHYCESKLKWFSCKIYPAARGGVTVYFRDITETRNQLRQKELLTLIDRQTVKVQSPESTAGLIMELLANHLGIDRCAVWFSSGDVYHVVSEYSRMRTSVMGAYHRSELGEELAAMLEAEHPVAMPDLRLEGLYPPLAEAYEAHGVRSVLIVPVTKQGELAAGLVLQHSSPRMWTTAEICLSQSTGVRLREMFERHRITAELEANERRLNLAQSAGRLGSFEWWIPEGSIIWSNALNELWGLGTNGFRGTWEEWLGMMAGGDGKCVDEILRKAFEARAEEVEYEFRAVMPSGKTCWFRGRARINYSPSGEPLCMIGVNIDIDEHVKRTELLRQANTDLEQFAYSASHDLQEPLRNISIYSELLTMRYSENLDDRARNFLGIIRNSATRMITLVKDLLFYAKLGNSNEAASQEADANDALEFAKTALAEQLAEAGAQVESVRLPVLRMARVHLEQLFINLIGNAVKYRSAAVPRVAVSAALNGRNWTISVSDNGIGIDPQYHDVVFGLFKRLHTADLYEGTGVGLAICQRVVERHGQKIWFESRPGLGSIFHFTAEGAGTDATQTSADRGGQ